MSGVSSAELLLLLVIGLIVLGPKRLPEIANKIGGWVGQARRMTRVMKRQLEEELNIDDLNNIKAPQIDLLPDPTAAPDSADPAYDDTDYVAEADAPDETDAATPEHVPNDDDTFSPLHAEDDKK